MRQLTKEYRFQAMSLYLQAITHEKQILKNEIEFVMKDFLQENDEGFDIELDAGYIAFKHYNELREKRIKSNEVELAHLYYLPKAHKLGTPLRPIISGLKHPTIRISKFLDELLRPLFDKITSNTTVTSGTKVIKQLHEWSKRNIGQETFICTMDVMDLYTMIPQTEVRGGDMGSSLTLTSANCYMFFYERDIVKQVNNSNGLYLRYIDDIFIIINWPIQHLSKQINRWNELDLNIKLKAQKYNQPERRTTTTTTTASYKRRQRRIPQQQYHNTTDQNEKNYNRFTALEQIDTSTDIESNYDDETNDVLSIAEYDIADHNEKEQMK
ncbi:unnamed protein product [Rotaria sp. Silwood1]|nr:unnamed protein product [Rotaria sp. Silwood1]